jgi:hypothetical protein
LNRLILSLLAVLCAGAAVAAETAAAPDSAEPGSVEEIAAATTEARFLSPWVAYLPASSTVPSPRRFFGRISGAPGELVDSAKAYAYARALAAASPRVRLFTIGRSEEGRDIVLLAIADEKGIENLDRLKGRERRARRSAHDDAAAAESADRGIAAVLLLQRGLHSDETGSTESVLELAYRLAVSDQPMIRRIRENMVVLINPVCNPDGRDKQVEWFYRFLKGKTELGDAAAPVAAVLVQVRLGRHQSRRASADPRNHEGREPHVLRVAPGHRARPARERGAC